MLQLDGLDIFERYNNTFSTMIMCYFTEHWTLCWLQFVTLQLRCCGTLVRVH